MIEVVVVVTISVFMLGLAVTSIHLLLRAERNSTQDAWNATSLARFTRVFRNDVHTATAVKLVANDEDQMSEVLLQRNEGPDVSFTSEGHRIVRVVTEADTVQHRDVFYLPRGSTVGFETTEAPSLVRAIIHRAPQTPPSAKSANVKTPAARTLHIDAALASDHRFAAKEAP